MKGLGRTAERQEMQARVRRGDRMRRGQTQAVPCREGGRPGTWKRQACSLSNFVGVAFNDAHVYELQFLKTSKTLTN